MNNTTTITTDYLTYDRNDYIGMISDTHKSVYGVRPHFYDWDNMDIIDLHNELTSLQSILEDQIKEEDKRDTQFMMEWNKELQIYLNMGMSRFKGVREMLRCRNLSIPHRNSRMDFESLCYELGFPWDYQSELREDLYGI